MKIKNPTPLPGIPSRQEILSWVMTEMLDQNSYERLSAPGGIFEHCRTKNDAHQTLRGWRTGTRLAPKRVQALEIAVFDVVLQADCALRNFKNEDDRKKFAEAFWQKYRNRATNRMREQYPEKADTAELAVILLKFLQWNEFLIVEMRSHRMADIFAQELWGAIKRGLDEGLISGEDCLEFKWLSDQSVKSPSEEVSQRQYAWHERMARKTGNAIFRRYPTLIQEQKKALSAVKEGRFIWKPELLEEAGFVGESVRFAWMNAFVLPYLAVCFAEFSHFFKGWDAGMSAGLHWYLPQPLQKKEDTIKMPCSKVLEWWEDLFGQPLKGYVAMKNPKILDVERDDIHEWKIGKRVMSWNKIMAWTDENLDWNPHYQGAFDWVKLPEDTKNRWRYCLQFLDKKWHCWQKLNPVANAGRTDDVRFREWIGYELRSYTEPDDLTWADLIICSEVPKSECVDALCEELATRWARPSNLDVRRRLMLAAAMQRLFSKYCGQCPENPTASESAEGYGPLNAEFARLSFVSISNGAMAAMNELARTIGPEVGRSRYIVQWIRENFKVEPAYTAFHPYWENLLLGSFDREKGLLHYVEAMVETQRNAASLDVVKKGEVR